MDLTATHLNGTPLRLQEMLYSKDGDLIHDVVGIHNNLDRRTGRMMNCFLPRYADTKKMAEMKETVEA
jgi:hypothetical protein